MLIDFRCLFNQNWARNRYTPLLTHTTTHTPTHTHSFTHTSTIKKLTNREHRNKDVNVETNACAQQAYCIGA